MKNISAGLTAALLLLSFPGITQPGQSDYRMSLFNDYDFQIIENYIRLKGKGVGSCHEWSLTSEELQVRFSFTANHFGWKVIRITSLKGFRPAVDYCLNHESPREGRMYHSTVLTSSRGEKTNQLSFQHFYLLLEQVKRDMLTGSYLVSLSQYLISRSGDPEGQLASPNIRYELCTVNASEKYVEIDPGDSGSHIIALPYRVWEKRTKRRSQVRWEYLVNDEHRLPDDFFFMNFSNLLLLSKPSGVQSARNLP